MFKTEKHLAKRHLLKSAQAVRTFRHRQTEEESSEVATEAKTEEASSEEASSEEAITGKSETEEASFRGSI